MNVTLVTGATGLVGTHLIKHLKSNRKIIALLHDEPVWSEWLQECLSNTVKVKGDVRDTQFVRRVINQYQVTEVVHLAAQSIVKRAYKDPSNTFAINVMGTASILEACRQLQTPKVLIQSTDKVYGDNTQAIVDSKLVATEPYGTSKVCVDLIAQTYRQTYEMPITITRPCNIYGYDPCNDRIVPNTIKKCMKRESPTIFKDEVSVRQYVFIEDVCEIIEDLLTVETAAAPIVNIASNTIRTQQEVVLEILKNFPGLVPEYVEKPFLREIHSQRMSEFVKAKKPVSFSEGIKKTVEQFVKYGW